ncbi:MAG: bifunctional DNA-formamidopyrimidine glycosylase/DNA-(apurinic or apyrimidinic site) lyase [Pantoea sp. Brub]|nr:bifunctional DNA-formamidopyrimidine glycosylase/DNA-(apurinic or apyrimidinic site) lyase [Pantoea sp. Brub]
MPELPEIETILYNIKPYLIGKKIAYILVRNVNLRWLVSKEILNLHDELILNIKRKSKYLLLKLQYGWIMIHLGMSGSLRILFNDSTTITKHDHIDLVLHNHIILRYNDPRRFGCWLWYKKLSDSNLLSKIGIEPLSKNFNKQYLFIKTRNKNVSIKQLLIDNKIVAGIGNIYSNESLFIAGINPERSANSLNLKEIKLLINSIKHTLRNAIKYGGTTLRNFSNAYGIAGDFNQKLKVYGRKNKLCLLCKTSVINAKKQCQRMTYWCDVCQH